MGGSGSGRWGTHTHKQRVEDALSLSIDKLKECLNSVTRERARWSGTVDWSRAGRITSRIALVVHPGQGNPTVRLMYTVTKRDGTEMPFDYTVQVTSTTPNYGGRRWWWICPLVKHGQPCERRVAKLYIPGGATLLGCRHCYELTYESCQDSHKYDSLFALIAADLQDRFPGMDGRTAQKLLTERWRRK